MLKRLLDFYVGGSLHVALSAFAMVQVTCIRLGLPMDVAVSGFTFFGTVVGYNFVKYDAIARSGKSGGGMKMRAFILLSFVSFIATAWFFFQMEIRTQLVSVGALVVTALYTLPFFPNRRTARDWAGLKIYFVALCWVAVTVAMPVIDSGIAIDGDFPVMCLQRFLLVVVLLFIFEIIDLQWDDPHLKTVPQQIGVERTKILGVLLVLVIMGLEFLKTQKFHDHIPVNVGFAVLVCGFLLGASDKRSRFYSTFWAEALPVFWWLALIFL